MDDDKAIVLRLTAPEAELLTTALRLLESTLGHDEADELVAVQQLIAKLSLARH